MNTLNRKTLADAVAQDCNLTGTASRKAVEAVLMCISEALIEGKSVELRGFGCFRPRVDPGRIVRDPRAPDKGSYRMPPRITVKFIPGAALAEALNASD